MEIKLDLHIHSEHSPDGRMTLQEIAGRCRAEGLHGFAVCDHDRVLTEQIEFPDLLVIPGVEVSTQYGHLLGLFVTEPVQTRDLPRAVELIHAQGGIAVLAHPFEHAHTSGRIDPIVPLLDGVEVWNSRAVRNHRRANAQAAEFAARHGLHPFAGSDAHLPQEIGNACLTVDADALTLDAVKAALLEGHGRADGRRSPARYTAMSQYTRRKRTGSTIPGWCKWALFALKCCLQDLIRKGESPCL